MLKKFLFTLFFLILSSISCFADFSGSVNYTVPATKDINLLLRKANDNLKMYEKTENSEQKSKYLKEALRYYYICTKINFSNIDAHIGLGKVYDEMKIDKYAKMEFNTAYNINNKNPKLNYLYGDYYYKRRQLAAAQGYFERAYKYGYANNADLNLKMSKAYTRLAQQQKADAHLKIANELSKDQKTKLAVNNAIKQASGVGSIPAVAPTPKVTVESNNEKPKIAQSNPVSTGKKDKIIPRPVNKHPRFEEAVVKANTIKMIDDFDNHRPMYYLFVK